MQYVKEIECQTNEKECCKNICESQSTWFVWHYWTEESSRFHGKVEKCCRPTEINCMADTALRLAGQQHCWIRTSKKEVGLGGAGNQLPEEVGSSPIASETELTDHSGQGTRNVSKCTLIPGSDEDCVNDELNIGKKLGKWSIDNNCNTVTDNILRKCHCVF